MTLIEILFARKTLISFAVVIVVSLILLFFPLMGALGFEFSLIMAFTLAFISVFLSAEHITLDMSKKFDRERRVSDLVASIFILNFFLLAIPFVVGLTSSVVREDCSIKEGVVFFLLFPAITVFFSASLGILLGSIFPRRGFLLGALLLLSTIGFSLWKLYLNPPIFFYNTVIGFFPGPLYDEVIPVTFALIVYRLGVVCWGLLFLMVWKQIRGFKSNRVNWGSMLVLVVLILILALLQLKKEGLGITYTRSYITKNFLSESLETEHFVLYYAPGTPEAKQIGLIANDHEWRYGQLQEFLQVSSRDKIRSYIYPDIETRKKLIGAGQTTIANPIHRELHITYESFPDPILKHELTHVMSSEFGMRILRVSPKVGLIEGLAVAADWSAANGLSPHQWSKAMSIKGVAPDIKEIIGLGFWYAPQQKSYTLMGSFCRYLIDAYGIEKFKDLYRTGDFSAYERNLDALVSEWRKFLDGIYIPESAPILAEYRFSSPSIFQAQCPRKVAALRDEGLKAFKQGNLYQAKKFFNEALGFDERNAGLIDSLAYIYYYDKNYDKVLDLVTKSHSLPQVDRNILENLRGNVLWQSGKVAQAEALFESLLEETLPDDIKREIEIKLSSMRSGGAIEAKMSDYFGTRDRLNQVVALEEMMKVSPDYGPAYYLLGRMFFYEGNYELASFFLSKSESLMLPSENLQKENSRILGTSLFAIGNYQRAIESFQNLSNRSPDGALKEFAVDFMERCQWTKNKNLK
jgi:tetratricopeptide (TPR) repeat protein